MGYDLFQWQRYLEENTLSNEAYERHMANIESKRLQRTLEEEYEAIRLLRLRALST